MRLRRGFHCFLWGSVASLLYASPTNSDRDLKSAPAHREASAGLVLPDAAPVRSNATVVRSDATVVRSNAVVAQPDPPPLAQSDPAPAEPAFKLAAVTPPDTSVGSSGASPPSPPPELTYECLLAQDCIDQYLWSLY